MLGKTAGGLFWLFRYLERSENMARLVEAGLRMALTRRASSEDEWRSIILTAGGQTGFDEKHDAYSYANVVNYLLRDRDNPASVLTMVEAARSNARLTRVAITREVWEAVNDCWMELKRLLARQIKEPDLPDILGAIRRQNGLVRGALHGTMLRNENYNFARIGTFLERADNTARILDVKYYVLLPSLAHVGSSLDNVQWDNILRSVSAQRAYRWLNPGDTSPMGIAEFLVLDRRFPRSLAFCYSKIVDNLGHLEKDYGQRHRCHDTAQAIFDELNQRSIDDIIDEGLHEFIEKFIGRNISLAGEIERDFRFYG